MLNVLRIQNLYRETRIFSWLVFFGLKDVNESLIKFVADFLITSVRLGVMLTLYFALFQYKGGEIMGVSFQAVAWSMFFYLVFNQMAFRRLPVDLQKDIQTGRVEILFPKPINYLHFKIGEYVGVRLTTFMVAGVLGTGLMTYFLDVPGNVLTLNFAVTFPLVMLFCFILSYQINAIIGLLSFWVEDTSSVRWLVDKMTMILGGAYFPVAFFPEILKNISLYSPLGASQFVSYSAFSNWSVIYLKMFVAQLFWIFFLGIFLFWLQKKAFGKLSVNGG